MQNTPPLAPRTAAVPLITPRYQRKSRTNRQMEVTDSFPDHQTPTGALRQHSTERMTIRNGPQQYDQEVHFHTYDVYRHGKRQIHSRSVGYSSDGDLVMTREDLSEPSDVDNGFTRRTTVISEPTVLDPRARRPLTDSEVNRSHKLHLNRPRYKKYPGVRAPRNRKLRNRLQNDYFATEFARKILDAARERRESGLDDTNVEPRKSFVDLPGAVRNAFDMKDDAQERELQRLGVQMSPAGNYVAPPRDPDSADARFQALNLRLRGELQHALNSEFLTQQIEDLEVGFREFIKRGETTESLVYHFRDGYGRLVCHGVAAYYQLVSESRLAPGSGETKLTYVALPKSRKTGVRVVNLPYTPLIQVLRGNRTLIPARHCLSANNTPQHGAAPDPAGASMDTLLEPMSPLDLNDTASGQPELQPPPPLPASTTPGKGRGRNVVAVSSTSSDDDEDGGADAPVRNASRINPTVFMTVNGKLSGVEVPVYVPQLMLSADELAPMTASENDGGSQRGETPGTSPEMAPRSAHSTTRDGFACGRERGNEDGDTDPQAATPPLTATQRKKLRKAEKAKAASSQENTPVMRPAK